MRRCQPLLKAQYPSKYEYTSNIVTYQPHASSECADAIQLKSCNILQVTAVLANALYTHTARYIDANTAA